MDNHKIARSVSFLSRIIFLSLIVSLSLGLSACGGDKDDNPTYTLSGTVSGDVSAGVTVTLSGDSSAATTTDGSGNYSFTGLANGAYTVTPSLAGYAFAPTSSPVTISNADATGNNFTATLITYTLSGTVSGDVSAGVTVTLSGDSSAATTTDGSGNYSFTGLANGAYTVTPSLVGYSFSPTSLAVTVSGDDATGRDFVSTLAVSSISGTVAGTEIIAVNNGGDIVVSDDTAGKTPDINGNYPFTLSGIPLGVNIRVYLITGSGVYPLYFDSNTDGIPDTNVFSLSAAAAVDLGFVDTAVAGQDGRAIPGNSPLDVAGASAQAENTAVPAKASLIGTWGFSRLKHRNGGTWAAKSGKFIYKADGTGSTVWQENDNNILSTGNPTWTWTAANNADGSITLVRSYPDSSAKMRRVVIADDGMTMILDGTDNLNSQRFRVAVRMDPARTYTNADFSGNYYGMGYYWDGIHAAVSSDGTADGAGNYSAAFSGNFNGTVASGTESGAYSIAADGSVALIPDIGAPGEGHLSGNGVLGIEAKSTSTGVWRTGVVMKKADRAYATADLAGTWAFIVFGDGGGLNFFAELGTMNCDNSGNCASNYKQQRDGVVSVGTNPPNTILVQSDGSFGTSFGSATPAFAGAIGNNGNMFILNQSFEDTVTRAIIVGVKCNACTGLENGGPVLTQITSDPAGDRSADWSPDGTRIVFKSDQAGNDDIWIMDADGGNRVQLTSTPENEGHPHFSPDGTKIVFWSERTGNRDIFIMNSDGTGQTNITNNAANDGGGSWSPDGTRILFRSDRAGNNDVWIMNADGSGLTQLTTDAAGDGAPQFSPDGTRIAFWSARSGNGDIWIMNADGSNPTQLTSSLAIDNQPHFSPDGSKIVFYSDRSGSNDIWMMNSDGSSQVRLTSLPSDDRDPDFSPDGTKIAFQSDRSGNFDIWTYALP